MSDQKSFTLIELLIVIGILAILVAAVVVTLNPAQLLAQARDSKRQQDLSALNQALNTITALDQSLFMGTSSIVYTSLPDSTTTCANWNLPSLPSGWQYHCSPTTTLQNTDGTGWIPVNFKTTGVVSLSSLPIDPQNTSSTGLYYTYVTGGSFQLASHFESAKYQATQGSDAMYTVGSNTTLAPFLSGLVGWWKFDEGSGTAIYDSSGYNASSSIVVNSSTYSWTNGKIGTAINWQPTCSTNCQTINSYVSVNLSKPISLTPGTISLWAKSTSGGFFTLLRASDGTDAIGLDSRAWFSSGYQNSINCNLSATSSWVFVAVSYNGNTINCFQNAIMTASGHPPITTAPESFGSFNIATRDDHYADFFSGLIDDVRIYNRALSPAEIQALYNATK